MKTLQEEQGHFQPLPAIREKRKHHIGTFYLGWPLDLNKVGSSHHQVPNSSPAPPRGLALQTLVPQSEWKGKIGVISICNW